MKDAAQTLEALKQAKEHILAAQTCLSYGIRHGLTGRRAMYELLRLSDGIEDAVEFVRSTT